MKRGDSPWHCITLLTICFVLSLSLTFAEKATSAASPVEVVERNGSVVVYNMSDQPIAGLCGTFDYIDPVTGLQHTVRWTTNFAGVFFDTSKFIPARGGEYRFDPPPEPNSNGTLRQFNTLVSGVVFADGATWGSQGHYLGSRLAVTASEARLQLMEIKQILEDGSFEENARHLIGHVPLVNGRNAEVLHIKLRNLLTTDDVPRRLRPDYMEQIDSLIAKLGKF